VEFLWTHVPLRELPHFEGMKREDAITFIQCVDEMFLLEDIAAVST